MSKKKKIFKQKIRQMLQEVERGAIRPTLPEQSPGQPIEISQKESIVQVEGQARLPHQAIGGQAKTTSVPTLAIAPINIVKSDIKKIAIIFLIIIIVIIAVAIVSQRTNFISIFSDKLYNWVQLGS